MALPSEELDQLYDAVVHDQDGDRIGTVGQIYLDDATEEPTFITVRTGLFGTKESFVPVCHAEYTDDGEVQVPYDKVTIKECPLVDPEGHLDADEQATLYTHYGVDDAPSDTAPTDPAPTDPAPADTPS